MKEIVSAVIFIVGIYGGFTGAKKGHKKRATPDRSIVCNMQRPS